MNDTEEFDIQTEFIELYQQAEEQRARLQQGIAELTKQGGGNQAVVTVMQEIGGVYDLVSRIVAASGTAFDIISPEEQAGSRLTEQDAEELRQLLLVMQKLTTELLEKTPPSDAAQLLMKVLGGIATKLQWIDDVTIVDDDDDDDSDDVTEDEGVAAAGTEGGDEGSSASLPALPSGNA